MIVMSALIYQPAKNAMQSGRAKTKFWILEFDRANTKGNDPLTGWSGSDDMQSEVKLKFDTCQDAERYAKRHGLEYSVRKTQPRIRQSKSYSENFSADRRQTWTH
jgi:hypothetical protein